MNGLWILFGVNHAPWNNQSEYMNKIVRKLQNGDYLEHIATSLSLVSLSARLSSFIIFSLILQPTAPNYLLLELVTLFTC